MSTCIAFLVMKILIKSKFFSQPFTPDKILRWDYRWNKYIIFIFIFDSEIT